ncbi:MAG TPA: MYXO-CTERM sorting domain-containing protein, partial [Myxococcaceae bacterium]|nr:MYXO-CTERM sorting domain-containing protein [Myxococcaceae bacterium]
GAAACGATTTASGAGSVLSYVNASAPSTPSVSSPVAPIAAGSSVLLPVTVADPDGDAVWVTSQQTAPSSPLLDIVAVEDGAGTSLKITAPSGPICGGDVPITLQVKAEDGRAGHVSAPAQLAITVAGTAPSVGQVSGGPLLASCQVVAGAPVVLAAADLIRTAAPDACPSDTIQWSQISGPPALAGTVTGDVASLRAQGAEWDDLVGREVQLQLVASSGSAIASPVAHAVSIAPQQPFVRATLSSEMPIVSESGVVGISLTLMNESGCGVRGATAAASLEGGQVLPGTVRLDGAPVSAEVTPEGIRLTSVPLAPGVPRVIRFDVRPALVGSPAPRAVATMGGVPISAEAGLGTRPEPGRCGCTSGGETLAGWGALLAVALHRRRRVVTPRCRTSP